MKAYALLYLFFGFFPYLKIVPNHMYNQPYALCMGVGALFFLRNIRLAASGRPIYISSLILAVSGLVLYVFVGSDVSSQELKSLVAYVSPLILITTYYHFLTRYPKECDTLLVYSFYAWLFVSIVQATVFPGLGAQLVGGVSSVAENTVNSGRGALGFAPEPTHNGFIMILFAAMLALIGRLNLAIIALAASLVLAKSSSCLLVMFIAMVIMGLSSSFFVTIAIAIISASVWFLLLPSLLPFLIDDLGLELRILSLLARFVENPMLLLADYSVNVRMAALWAIPVSLVDNGFFPAGMSNISWVNWSRDFVFQNPWVYDLSRNGLASGYGVLLYQSGWVAFYFIGAIFSLSLSSASVYVKFICVSAATIFIFQFSISTPIFAIFIAYMLRSKYDLASEESLRLGLWPAKLKWVKG